MNILYLGAESANFVIHTCNALCRQGHTVTAVVQTLDEYDKENPIPLHKNLKRINIEYEKYFKPKYVFNKLIIEMQTDKFDMLFGSHAPVSPVLAELSHIYKIPWGIMILDIPTHTMRTERNRMRLWLYWFDILKHINTIIFNNSIARDEYYNYTKQWFPNENVIHYGTNMPEEYKGAGLDIEGDYILSVCRIHPYKNCKAIAQALSLLNTNLKYVAVGKNGGELDLIKKICKKHNIPFEYKGIVTEKEKWELIKNCKMYIYPQTTKYIAGQATLEAMWAGKPVLTGNYEILKELYGKYPFYFNTDSSIDLAIKIATVNSMKSESTRDNRIEGIEHAYNTSNYDTMAAKMIGVFKRVIAIAESEGK